MKLSLTYLQILNCQEPYLCKIWETNCDKEQPRWVNSLKHEWWRYLVNAGILFHPVETCFVKLLFAHQNSRRDCFFNNNYAYQLLYFQGIVCEFRVKIIYCVNIFEAIEKRFVHSIVTKVNNRSKRIIVMNCCFRSFLFN